MLAATSPNAVMDRPTDSKSPSNASPVRSLCPVNPSVTDGAVDWMITVYHADRGRTSRTAFRRSTARWCSTTMSAPRLPGRHSAALAPCTTPARSICTAVRPLMWYTAYWEPRRRAGELFHPFVLTAPSAAICELTTMESSVEHLAPRRKDRKVLEASWRVDLRSIQQPGPWNSSRQSSQGFDVVSASLAAAGTWSNAE